MVRAQAVQDIKRFSLLLGLEDAKENPSSLEKLIGNEVSK